MSYYNTNKTTGQTLLSFTHKANSQQELVYQLFLQCITLSWCDCKKKLPDMNEISIKRSITDLYKEGRLTKTEEMVLGIYGKKVHKYKLS